MANILDTFTLRIVARGTTTEDRITASFAIQDNGDTIEVVQGQSTELPYTYSLGRPKATSWYDITILLSGVTANPAPGVSYAQGAPRLEYNHDENALTPDIPKLPRTYQTEAFTITAGNAVPGDYVVTAGIVQPD